MRNPWTAAVLVCAGSLLAACGQREEPRPSPPEKAVPPAVAEATPPPQPTSAAEPAAATKSSAAAPRTPRPETASVPQRPAQAGAGGQASPPPQAAAPAPTAAPAAPSVDSPKPAPPPSAEGVKGVVDPGGAIAVPPAKDGLERVGAEKCKLCHKLQYESWAASKHAQRTPPLDCESCHGAGSEYRTLAVMKDPAKAKAAGLVLPGASFCAKCHKGVWNPALIGKVHAHKVAP